MITARFKTLKKAIAEARKYGVFPVYPTLCKKLNAGETPAFYITLDRKVTFARVPDPDRPFMIQIDVYGQVIPVAGNLSV